MSVVMLKAELASAFFLKLYYQFTNVDGHTVLFRKFTVNQLQVTRQPHSIMAKNIP